LINSDWCRSSTLALWLLSLSLASGASAQIADVSLPDAPTARLVAVADQATSDQAAADQANTQSGDLPAGQPPSSPAPPATQNVPPPTPAQTPIPAQTEREKAQQQLNQEEKQRIIGIVPNFNTSYVSDAVPLSPRQKLSLAFRSSVDPFVFFAAGVDAAIGQAQNSFAGYGQGWGAYGKYFGASYLDDFDGTMIGNAFLPILLKQDPRYFRLGTGTFKHRLLYSISTTFWCKNDNQKWGPNYSNVLGNLAAGGISNLYYPASDRGAALTIERGFTVTAEGTIGGFFDEFWPDIAHKIFKGRYAKLQGNIPGSTPAATTPPPATTPPATPPP
jgi:hypothetical protein